MTAARFDFVFGHSRHPNLRAINDDENDLDEMEGRREGSRTQPALH